MRIEAAAACCLLFATLTGVADQRGSAEGLERWEYWWVHNAEAFLSSDSNTTPNHPAGREIRSSLVPVLLDLLATSEADVAAAAALALARLVPADESEPKQVAALIAVLGHPQKSVREAATLALGVLGRSEAVEPLRALLDDTAEGCRLTNAADHVEPLVRAFAAAALGMLHGTPAIDDLVAATHRAAGGDSDVQAMALLALGMMTERQDDIAKLLVGVLEDATAPTLVRAQAPIALAKLARGSGVGSGVAHALLSKHLLPLFRAEHTDVNVARSLAIALGHIATIDDADALDALIGDIHDGKDEQTRHFAMIALAQIGARDATPANHAPAHTKLRDLFLVELTAPKRITHEPFGALGFAIYARNLALAPTTKREAVDQLLAAFKRTTNSSYAGAMALGLGMLRARDAADDLWQRWLDTSEESLKGHLALAMGMAGIASHVNDLRSSLEAKHLGSNFRLELGRALGLLADPGAAPVLIDLLDHGDTDHDSSAAAQALARIGDAGSIPPLLAIAKDPTKSPRSRSLAIGALGRLAEKTPRPWRALFDIDMNYLAMPPAVVEILHQF